jgi:NADH-quinone oxidoreductase subunit K
VLARRNLLFILLCVEIMLNAAGLAFIVAGSRWGQADGQVMFIFLLSMAAAEVAVGLALILLLYSRRKDLDSDALGSAAGPAVPPLRDEPRRSVRGGDSR